MSSGFGMVIMVVEVIAATYTFFPFLCDVVILGIPFIRTTAILVGQYQGFQFSFYQVHFDTEVKNTKSITQSVPLHGSFVGKVRR